MKVISFDNIRALDISPKDCYQWVSDMIENKSEAFLPAKTHMNMPGNVFCNVMPCLVRELGSTSQVGGVKVVTRYPNRKPSLDSKILLFKADSGEFLALMDGNWITAMRTGAVAAHSIINFARSDWQTVAIIGLGNVARSSMLILSEMTGKEINVKLLRYKNQAEDFRNRFKDNKNLHFSVVDSVEEGIKGSDVILSCATYFENDIAQDEWFDEGILVVPVHTRGFTNCDLFFDKVFADDTGHVDHFKNFAKFRYYAEVSDVVNGRSVGRENDKERILAYNIGVSIHDINYAAHIYQMMKRNPQVYESLIDANMHDPTEKFWI